MLEYDRIRSVCKPDTNVCVRALVQNSGMGRGGHRWNSPQNGLWFTFDLLHREAVGSFALFAGHCLHKLLVKLYMIPNLHIKWTNDLYYKDKKVAGLLCRYQMVDSFYVIGLGINTNNLIQASKAAPNPCSLKEIIGFEISNDMLMKLFIQEVYNNQSLLNNPQEYLDYCNEHLYGKGRLANIEQDGKSIQGRILSLNEKGNLLLDVGKTISVNYGSLRIL